MRLGLVIYGSLATVSGGYLYDRKLVEHLRGAGDTVEVISLPWRNYARHLADNLSAALAARLRGARCDVLLQDELNHPSLFWVNHRLRGVSSYPTITVVHHLRCSERRPAWQNAAYRLVERAYLRSVDGFVFNSQTTRAAVEGLVGAGRAQRAAQPFVVAYPAGDRFQPAPSLAQIEGRVRQPGPRQLLFIGNVIPRKGLHTLLDALAQLRRADWHLHVAGSLDVDRGYRGAIQAQIARLLLATQVTLHGNLDDARLRALLEGSHALVVPSTYEGFGIVYLEGMSFGLPAVATTAGAAGEIITPGEDGYLVPPDDPAPLAHAVRRLLDDPAHLLSLSLAARRRYDRHPTWAASMARVRTFIQSQADRPPTRSGRTAER
jgi:glycosyltransferase involved in cell wall biosynthesis